MKGNRKINNQETKIYYIFKRLFKIENKLQTIENRNKFI